MSSSMRALGGLSALKMPLGASPEPE
jgi:hypothetical protein